jgi:site-specific recombinase XerD
MGENKTPADILSNRICTYHQSIGRKYLNRRPRILKALIAFVKIVKKPIEHLTARDMESFIDFLLGSGLSHRQIAQEFSILRRFYDYLCDQGFVQTNVARMVFARAHKQDPRIYTDEELSVVFHKHHPRP